MLRDLKFLLIRPEFRRVPRADIRRREGALRETNARNCRRPPLRRFVIRVPPLRRVIGLARGGAGRGNRKPVVRRARRCSRNFPSSADYATRRGNANVTTCSLPIINLARRDNNAVGLHDGALITESGAPRSSGNRVTRRGGRDHRRDRRRFCVRRGGVFRQSVL